MPETFVIQFDGGSRGNPGPAGYGAVVLDSQGVAIVTYGNFLGVTTNNVAEYQGLIAGLRKALELKLTHVMVRGDSQLVINQMRGVWKVKHANLIPLNEQAQKLARQFASIRYEHNLRESNELADKLCNMAINRKGEVNDIDD